MHPSLLSIPLPSGLTFDMIFVEGGTFLMGDDQSEYKSEKPVHKVTVPSFYMGKYPVTQVFWEAVMKSDPAYHKGENRPVERVSWDDAQDFIRRLNEQCEKSFRLPTEAEWEYAARGGRYSQGFVYAGSDKLKQVGWYRENSENQTHDVGMLLPNELGLFDMSGNVWEWCEDDWHDNYTGAPENGSARVDAPKQGVGRVVRGGGSFGNAVLCRCADRTGFTPDDRDSDLGFRLVLPLQLGG